jgi:hypothetical protein
VTIVIMAPLLLARFYTDVCGKLRSNDGGGTMAELTVLESKLGEVLGLAMAAKDTGKKVARLAKRERAGELVETLDQMAREAAETEERCKRLADELEGKKSALLRKARETKREATEMASTYLGDDADALDGFEFLTMAEAGEVGHWEIVDVLARRAGRRDVQELAGWAKPIQQRHLELAREGSLKLAEQEDPDEPA